MKSYRHTKTIQEREFWRNCVIIHVYLIFPRKIIEILYFLLV